MGGIVAQKRALRRGNDGMFTLLMDGVDACIDIFTFRWLVLEIFMTES